MPRTILTFAFLLLVSSAVGEVCPFFLLAEVAGNLDTIRKLGENARYHRQYVDFKNGPNPNPKVVDLSAPNLHEPSEELGKQRGWSGQQRVPGLPTRYEESVLRLRKGDTVVFDGKSYHLGKFLGAGNSAHIYELSDRPGLAIRIPFVVPAKLPMFVSKEDGDPQKQRLSAIRRPQRIFNEKHKGRAGAVPILETPDPEGRFLIVKKVEGIVTGASLIAYDLKPGKSAEDGMLYYPADFDMERMPDPDKKMWMPLMELLLQNRHAVRLENGQVQIVAPFLTQYLYDDSPGEGRWYLLDVE